MNGRYGRESTERACGNGPVTLPEAYADLWKEMLAHAERVVRDRCVAEDVVSDVFAWLLEHPDRWHPTNVRAYLIRAVYSRAISRKRKDTARRRRNARWVREQRSVAPRPDDELHRAEFERRLQAGIEGLPSRQGRAFSLVLLEGVSYREAARRMGSAKRRLSI